MDVPCFVLRRSPFITPARTRCAISVSCSSLRSVASSNRRSDAMRVSGPPPARCLRPARSRRAAAGTPAGPAYRPRAHIPGAGDARRPARSILFRGVVHTVESEAAMLRLVSCDPVAVLVLDDPQPDGLHDALCVLPDQPRSIHPLRTQRRGQVGACHMPGAAVYFANKRIDATEIPAPAHV